MVIPGFTSVAWIALIGSVLAGGSFDVNLRVDFGTTLKTGGVQTFSRRQFINGHGTFKMDHDVPQNMIDYVVDELQVSFSRSSKGPFRHDDYPSRTAYSEVQEDGEKSLKDKESNSDYKEELEHMSELRVLTDDPFKIPEITHSESTRSTAISYAGYFFRYYFDNKYVLPRYYECFNEPIVKYTKLKNHGETMQEFVTRISDLCTDICKELQDSTPDVLSGGPANAYVRPSFQNFSNFQERMKVYMDAAAKGGCQKFISEHVYNIGGSYAEANLDLIQTYSSWLAEDGRPQPYVVSEMGQYVASWYNRAEGYAAPPLSSRDFLVISEAMKVLQMLMKVPDGVPQVITFINMETQRQRDITNGNPYPWSMIAEKDDGDVEFTNLIKYFELLKGLDGDFVYSSSDNIQLSVNAVATRSKGFIILQNLSSKDAEVTLNSPYGHEKLEKYERRRLRIEKKPRTTEEKDQGIQVGGDLSWKTSSKTASSGSTILFPENFLVEAYEMTVIMMHFKDQSRNLRTITRSRYFPTKVLDHENKETDFPAPITKQKKVQYIFSDIPSSPGGVAAIRIAHSRPDGKSVEPSVYVNDVLVKSSSISYDVAGGYRAFSDGSYFGEFIVYYNLEEANTTTGIQKVAVKYPDSGGFSTTVVLEIDECSGSSCCILAQRSEQTKCDGSLDSGKLRPRPRPMPN